MAKLIVKGLESVDYREEWRDFLRQNRAIAVIRCHDFETGVNSALAAADGGIRAIEITWNSLQPERLIAHLREILPDCPIGTGTVLDTENFDRAVSSGIQFCFTPHVNSKLIERAIESRIPIVAGALTPTEIVTAWRMGAACVKVFPVRSLGGVNYIKDLQGPLGDIPLIPTGGVTLDNAGDFIEAGAIAVGLSGELFPPDLVRARKWTQISRRASQLTRNLNKIKV